MASGLQLDHVVIQVHDLAIAQRNYAALGFTCVPGGEHPGLGSRNALIAFADGSYLELITFKHRSGPRGEIVPKDVRMRRLQEDELPPVECRVLPWESAGEGLVDFALVPVRIEDVMTRAEKRGLTLQGPFPGSRSRPDGQQVAWQFGVPETFDLPFLCADVTPRPLRVPEGVARQHGNGAIGIVGVTVVVDDLKASTQRYRALLGTDPREDADVQVTDAQAASFVVGTAAITLAEPIRPSGPLRTQLKERGEGPCSLLLRTQDPSRAGRLDLAACHGSPIVLRWEDKETRRQGDKETRR